ncbi:MraY family glycosyltransferase [Candidatus Pandoraea novymonadis]|uniref:Undecaprenyl-phosphate N-acetylglucosaminyl 1-phosphate transferase n=1 Tax=Candidatus Pandoraea novymonadis TaxID=1808959 RepID=A0ABX5FF64_9BURK|nr:glycosyltransferase [Candidatus Pandoraea novymonadis]PSB92348.1 putative undecaprenyl-phosphate N-acetylglucosaminyl 1-phosphate transferase [Candidatus Pandoraea novymonadis]
MLSLVIAMVVSFFSTLMIVRYANVHKRFSGDSDTTGIQKFHARTVPRIGGISILLGIITATLALAPLHTQMAQSILFLSVCGLPAFISGFFEDLTKSLSPRIRLIATMISALCAYVILDIHITRIGIGPLDRLLTLTSISVIFTVLCTAGMANALNIIDGFNGLAPMIAVIMFASLGYVGLKSQDLIVLTTSMIMIGAILGFFMLNFPSGLIFLGDGGAYFIGFILAELSILLVMHNPQVSPWYPALMVIYPVFEVCFSIYRKLIVRGISPSIPDGVHLHMLVYKRLMRSTCGKKTVRALTKRNSLTSPYLWLLCLLAVVPATIFWRNTTILVLCCLAFMMIYVWLYVRIIRFKAPRWLIYRKNSDISSRSTHQRKTSHET